MPKFLDINGVQAVWNKSVESFVNVEQAMTEQEIVSACTDIEGDGDIPTGSTTKDYIDAGLATKVDKVTGSSLVSNTLITDMSDAMSVVMPKVYIDLLRRIEALESIILSGQSTGGDVVLETVNVHEVKKFGQPLVLVGTGVPTRIPDFTGQFYINTSGPALYYSNGTESTSNWKQA